jgi:hypothetical protein
VTPDIGARRTRLATAISPIFKDLRPEDCEPVTGFSFFWQTLHRSCRESF